MQVSSQPGKAGDHPTFGGRIERIELLQASFTRASVLFLRDICDRKVLIRQLLEKMAHQSRLPTAIQTGDRYPVHWTDFQHTMVQHPFWTHWEGTLGKTDECISLQWSTGDGDTVHRSLDIE